MSSAGLIREITSRASYSVFGLATAPFDRLYAHEGPGHELVERLTQRLQSEPRLFAEFLPPRSPFLSLLANRRDDGRRPLTLEHGVPGQRTIGPFPPPRPAFHAPTNVAFSRGPFAALLEHCHQTLRFGQTARWSEIPTDHEGCERFRRFPELLRPG